MEPAERLQKLQKEAAAHLNQVILPFWTGLKDEKHGGYYGYVDFDLKTEKQAEKGCILNSRILWFFSNAYLTLKRSELLSYAEHAYHFLQEACLDRENGGVYWSVSFDGKPLDTTKHTYNQAFAVYALSSYYDASKDKEALETAWELYRVIESRCRDEYGYLEAFDRTWHLAGNEKLSENGVMAEKTMNTLLHVFEAYTELYRVTGSGEVSAALHRILNLFADRIYNPEKRRQEVFFDRTWHSLIDLHSYGHDIETSWLIDRGLKLLNDRELSEQLDPVTDALAEEIYRIAYKNHSVLNECDRGTVNTTRVWWVQAESVVGFLNYYRKHPDQTAFLDAAEDVWEYIKICLVDPRPGSEWFWDVDEAGKPSDRKPIEEPWKCPYHNGRMCMELIRGI